MARHARPRPDDAADAHLRRAGELKRQGRLPRAIEAYRRSLALRPDQPDACNNLGNTLQQDGQIAAAVACYRRALGLRADFPQALNNLANGLTALGQYQDAADCFAQALRLLPDYPQAQNNLGNLHKSLGRPDLAEASYRTALALAPNYQAARYNLANVLRERGQLDAAVAEFCHVLTADPTHADAAINLGNTLAEQGLHDLALQFYDNALVLVPALPDAHFNRSLMLLARGDLAEGWAEHEWRWKMPHMAKAGRGFAQPQWTGQKAAGQTLLIHAEQGFGDTMQFCRYAALAAARGLRVLLLAPRPLVRLLARLPGVAGVTADGDTLPPFDLHCPMLSLPFAFGTTLADVPWSGPYLAADPEQEDVWRGRLAGMLGIRVGLVWAGNPRSHSPALNAVDRRRSLPPERLAPLLDTHGIHWFSLQKDGPPSGLPVIDVMAGMADFADTAALIANLDLVIAVDTAVAHLAAAMGKPVWLLERFDSCWRWLSGRRDSPWYPTMRLYRQPSAGDWDTVLRDVAADLSALQAHRHATDAAALTSQGNASRRDGDLVAAVLCYRRALQLRPDFAGGHHNLGNALAEQGDIAAAIACYHRCLALQPDAPMVHVHLGNALLAAGNPTAAIDSFRQAIALRPDDAAAHTNLGSALRAHNQPAPAEAHCREAVRLKPDWAEAHNNLGSALTDDPAAAEACFRQALMLRPDFAEALNNLGNTLREQGRVDQAVACLRQADALCPDRAEITTSLALALLAQGDLEEGFRLNEARWRTPILAAAWPNFPQPQWTGQPAMGRTLLIHAEQGFGDTLQFCRYASLAAERGLRVLLRVQRPLVRLLGGLPGVEQVLADGDAPPPFDLHCPMLSLPFAFGTTLADVPWSGPYLSADPARADIWRARLADKRGLRVGLVWAGNPRSHAAALNAVDRRRSMPPDRLAPLLDFGGVHWFSLQKDGPKSGLPLIDAMPEMADFADTAALIANLDLVISVDTAVAHLAAAMGKPVWLLERFDSCWRWLSGRRDSPWYPTMRLYRQPSAGDWDAVLRDVAADLAALQAHRRDGVRAPEQVP